ncbi:hypothetical protein R0J90_21040, partial [Micrococcus sp. SIMBA_144]
MTLIKKLKISKVASTFATITGNSVELLGDLVIGAHYRYWLRRFNANLSEELSQVIGELELWLVGVSDLVMTEL